MVLLSSQRLITMNSKWLGFSTLTSLKSPGEASQLADDYIRGNYGKKQVCYSQYYFLTLTKGSYWIFNSLKHIIIKNLFDLSTCMLTWSASCWLTFTVNVWCCQIPDYVGDFYILSGKKVVWMFIGIFNNATPGSTTS